MPVFFTRREQDNLPHGYGSLFFFRGHNALAGNYDQHLIYIVRMEFVPHPFTKIHDAYPQVFTIGHERLPGHIRPGKQRGYIRLPGHFAYLRDRHRSLRFLNSQKGGIPDFPGRRWQERTTPNSHHPTGNPFAEHPSGNTLFGFRFPHFDSPWFTTNILSLLIKIKNPVFAVRQKNWIFAGSEACARLKKTLSLLSLAPRILQIAFFSQPISTR
jgi:hypothetical protein